MFTYTFDTFDELENANASVFPEVTKRNKQKFSKRTALPSSIFPFFSDYNIESSSH